MPSLPSRTLKRIAELLRDGVLLKKWARQHLEVEARELYADVEYAVRPSELRREIRSEKLVETRRRNDETSLIREAVWERSHGMCECGCGTILGQSRVIGEMDHARGRGKEPQSVENCWRLALRCHRRKTNNDPSAAEWVRRYAVHAQRHGYQAEVAWAESRLAVLAARGFAEAST